MVKGTKVLPGSGPSASDTEIASALSRIEESEVAKVAVFFRQLKREYHLPRDQANGVTFNANATVQIDGKTERQARVRVHSLMVPQIGHPCSDGDIAPSAIDIGTPFPGGSTQGRPDQPQSLTLVATTPEPDSTPEPGGFDVDETPEESYRHVLDGMDEFYFLDPDAAFGEAARQWLIARQAPAAINQPTIPASNGDPAVAATPY